MTLLGRLLGKTAPPPATLETALVTPAVSAIAPAVIVPSAPEPVSAATVVSRYLGILDTYGVSWTMEKVARDTLQNFFDGNNKTLDGVDVEVVREDDTHIIRICNHAEYDFRRLMHLGGTTKADDAFSAGGFGEGTKILALALLRDYGFSQLRFGSQDWELDFVLDDLPEGEYVERRKGLYARLSEATHERKGNFIEFKTSDPAYAQAFSDARALFFSAENPDFQHPSLDIPEIGGFKYIPRAERSRDTPKGNFYHAGQRRHFDKEAWNTVEHLHLWTHSNAILKKDRDRGVVSRRELEESVLPAMLDAASSEDLSRLVHEMKPIWSGTWSFEVGHKVLEGVAKRLADKGVKLEFDDNYLASAAFMPMLIKENLEKEGYVICHSFLGDIGMNSAQAKFLEMQRHYQISPTPEEEAKIGILYDGIAPLQKERKEIWIFDKTKERSIIQGQYNEAFVWLSRESLHKRFHEALAVYLHELDHEHGSDYSAEFSYALTDTLGAVIDGMLRQPDVYSALERRWSIASK